MKKKILIALGVSVFIILLVLTIVYVMPIAVGCIADAIADFVKKGIRRTQY